MAQKKPITLLEFNLTDKKQGFTVLSIGIAMALILGLLVAVYGIGSAWIYWLLVVGVVVGILNIFHEEGILFLILGLTMAFMLNVIAGLTVFPEWAVTLFNAVIYLLAPATVVVSLKVLYALATKD